MKKKLQRLALVLTFLLLLSMNSSDMPQITSVEMVSFARSHFLGGFNITASQMAQAAVNDGISEVQLYGRPAHMQSSLGQTLQSYKMHEIDSYIWTLLYEYECHRSKTVEPPGQPAYCLEDYPSMTAVNVLLS